MQMLSAFINNIYFKTTVYSHISNQPVLPFLVSLGSHPMLDRDKLGPVNHVQTYTQDRFQVFLG